MNISFAPKEVTDSSERTATVKISVMHNLFDTYSIDVLGTANACEGILDTCENPDTANGANEEFGTMIIFLETSKINRDLYFVLSTGSADEKIVFPEINLADGFGVSSKSIFLRSRSESGLRFDFSALESCSGKT